MPRPLKFVLMFLGVLLLISGGPFTLLPALTVYVVWSRLKVRRAALGVVAAFPRKRRR